MDDAGKRIPLVPDRPAGNEGEAHGGDAPTRRSVADLAPDPAATLRMQPRIVEVLSTIYDPEIPVNIYDLGLIYDVVVDAASTVGIRMTLTAPACPAAQSLPAEVERRVRALPDTSDVIVEIVWDPPWDRDRMSDAARLQLGMF